MHSDKKRIYARKGYALTLVLIGVSLFILSVVEFLFGGSSSLLLPAATAMCAAAGAWLWNNPVVRFKRDHVEMKFDLLSPLRLVLYEDIKAIKRQGRNVLLTVSEGQRIKRVRVRRSLFSKADFAMLVRGLLCRTNLA